MDRGISVKEINVERDRKAATDMVRKTGQMGVRYSTYSLYAGTDQN